MCCGARTGVVGPGGGGYGVPQRSIFQGVMALSDDPVAVVRDLGMSESAYDHYTTFGANDPNEAFTASASTDVVTALQTANLMSGYFPPSGRHNHVLQTASNLHSSVDSWRRNLLLDEICVE